MFFSCKMWIYQKKEKNNRLHMIDLFLNCGFGTYISANVSDMNQFQKNLITTQNQIFVDQINHKRKQKKVILKFFI